MTTTRTPTVTPNPMRITTLVELLNNPKARKYVLMALRHQRKQAAKK